MSGKCFVRFAIFFTALAMTGLAARADEREIVSSGSEVRVQEIKGFVEVQRAGSKVWDPAYTTPTNQFLLPGDHLRTRTNSYVTLVFSDLSRVHIAPFSEIEIRQYKQDTSASGRDLIVRLVKPDPIIVRVPAGVAMAPPFRPRMSAGFSPDGKSIWTTHTDNSVRLWDLETGQETGIIIGHTNCVQSVAFSPNGTAIP
jgi:WD40 repeat protein